MKDRLLKYLKSDRHLWWTVTLIPGAYCILYLYTNNFTLINSWYQLIACLLAFLVLPIVEIWILDTIFKKWLPKWRPHLYWNYLIINFAIILSLTVYLGWRWKALILIAVLTLASSFFIARHYKKLVLLISLMTLIAGYQFLYFYIQRVASHEDWVQKMAFEDLEFKIRPNIYLIQPDGFVGRQAASNPYYNLELADFYQFLDSAGLKTNDHYRSNYPSTLTSNAALFTAQHHFFDNGSMENELLNARSIITGKNPVLNTLKNNGYTTHLILQHAYLIMNFPDVAYDQVNIKKNEVSVPVPDYYVDKDLMGDFSKALKTQTDAPQFYFVELLEPGHIPGSSTPEEVEKEVANYKQGLYNTTDKLKKMVSLINRQDPSGIIILAADHGGFVGLNNTHEAFSKLTDDKGIKESIYNSLLSIKAPTDFTPYGNNIKSSIGLFPNLFAYLSDQPLPQDSIDNSSYMFIKEHGTRGVYKYFNTDGKPVTEKMKP